VAEAIAEDETKEYLPDRFQERKWTAVFIYCRRKTEIAAQDVDGLRK